MLEMAGWCNVGTGHGGSLDKVYLEHKNFTVYRDTSNAHFTVYRDTLHCVSRYACLECTQVYTGFQRLPRRRNTFLTRVLFNTVRAQAREVRLRGVCPARFQRHLTAHPKPLAPRLTNKERQRRTNSSPKLAALAGGRQSLFPSPKTPEQPTGPEHLPGNRAGSSDSPKCPTSE